MQKMQAMLLRWSIGASDITPSPCSMRDAKGSSNLRNKEFYAGAGHAQLRDALDCRVTDPQKRHGNEQQGAVYDMAGVEPVGVVS